MSTNAHNETSRDQVEMGKLFAEMMNLMADTRKKEEGRETLRAEVLKREDEREKLRAETRKMQGETKWHPLVVGAGIFSAGAVFLGAVVGALLALVKAFM